MSPAFCRKSFMYWAFIGCSSPNNRHFDRKKLSKNRDTGLRCGADSVQHVVPLKNAKISLHNSRLLSNNMSNKVEYLRRKNDIALIHFLHINTQKLLAYYGIIC